MTCKLNVMVAIQLEIKRIRNTCLIEAQFEIPKRLFCTNFRSSAQVIFVKRMPCK